MTEPEMTEREYADLMAAENDPPPTMTTGPAGVVAVPPVATVAGGVSHATSIEQSRAIAEVQGAIVVAQQVPRSLPKAIERMRESCSQLIMAERSFFRFPRGGKPVTGPTIHLARELARCFGNLQYGIAELNRNTSEGYSEMRADAWDVETNVRASTTFRVPHLRDRDSGKGGPAELVTMRDVYENNANMGARRVREMIFAVLPRWYTDSAIELAKATIAAKSGGDAPLPQRIATQVDWWRGKYGITVGQLETKLGRPMAEWTPPDLAELAVIGRSLASGETSKADEFPSEGVSVDEIKRNAAAVQS